MNKQERIDWIRKMVNEAGADGVAVAISGGIDSAVTAHLAKEAFPNNSLGIWLGIESSVNSRRNALRVFEDTGIEMVDLDLTSSTLNLFDDIFNIYKEPSTPEEYERQLTEKVKTNVLNQEYKDLIKGNLKARIRMVTLYAHAQNRNYLVLETSNLSEMVIGYFTKWGDGAGDLSPISDLTKREVYELGRELGVNEMVMNAAPSADLWEGQQDELELGFTYDQIEMYIKGEELPEDVYAKINNMHRRTNHKRTGAIEFKNVWEELNKKIDL